MLEKHHSLLVTLWAFTGIFCFTVLFVPAGSAQQSEKYKWWEVTPEEENPSPDYDSILYSAIAPRLHEITKNSNRVMVKIMGQSAGGRDLYMVEQGRLDVVDDRSQPEIILAHIAEGDVVVFLRAASVGRPDLGRRALRELAVRDLFFDQATIRSRVVDGKEDDGAKYKDYFQWEESAATAPSHRILAMRRGEKEDVLNLSIGPPEAEAIEAVVYEFAV